MIDSVILLVAKWARGHDCFINQVRKSPKSEAVARPQLRKKCRFFPRFYFLVLDFPGEARVRLGGALMRESWLDCRFDPGFGASEWDLCFRLRCLGGRFCPCIGQFIAGNITVSWNPHDRGRNLERAKLFESGCDRWSSRFEDGYEGLAVSADKSIRKGLNATSLLPDGGPDTPR